VSYLFGNTLFFSLAMFLKPEQQTTFLSFRVW